MAQPTKDWQLYEAGISYNNQLDPNYYELVDANWDFYSGNQWRGLPDSDMPKPVFNIIKRVVSFFVASLTSTRAKLHYEPMMYDKDNPDPSRANDAKGAEIANKQTENLFEKWKMEFRTKDALLDAANTGDMAAHLYFDMSKKPYGSYRPEIKGEICFELVDGPNVFFGNANTNRTEKQPYIGLAGRESIQALKEEAERYGNDPEEIKADSNNKRTQGYNNRTEMQSEESGKAEYIIIYRKVKKTKKTVDPMSGAELEEEYDAIMASKSVENAYIFQDIELPLTRFPIAWNNWETQKGTMHGRAIATGMLPNQIFINRMFAMVMYHLMRAAFPKALYNADLLPQWDDAVGSAIGIEGVGAETPLTNVATYTQPGDMSAQIIQALELAVQYTKEMLGASDAALGQIDPKNTSAIIAVQKSSAIPLENPKTNMYEWIEDIGAIAFDMMGGYYGPRPVMQEVPPPVDPMTGQPMMDPATMQPMGPSMQLVDYDFSQFKDLWLDIRADVGESSYWSEIAAQQTLDNLLLNGHLDIIQYLERVPDDMIPQKDQLIAEIRERMQQQAAQMAAQQAQMAEQQQQATSQAGEQQKATHQHQSGMKAMDIMGKLAVAGAQAQGKQGG